MANTITIKGIQNRGKRFLDCRGMEDMARLLGKPALQLLAMAQQPQYSEFSMPKKDGSRRKIENPLPALKKVQRKMNDYLQGGYYLYRTASAYGFLTNPVDDPSVRHILSNAQVHIGCEWLVNVDVKDFFHLILEERIQQLFTSERFKFPASLGKVLTGLCCYKGRLPMGAPTSPILSNIVCIEMDHALEKFADDQQMKYTRYADDITFSGKTEITTAHIQTIEGIIGSHDFHLNPNKIRLYRPEQEDKEVTGLIVRKDRIDLPQDYLNQLGKAINHLDQIMDAKYSTPSGRSDAAPWIKELEQQIRGKLEYARQILGEDDLQYQDLVIQIEEALSPPEHFGPMGWLAFGYSLPK